MSSSCLILLVIYLLALACLCSRHDFSKACLWFRLVDTLVLINARHLASHHHLPGSTDSSGFSCPGLGAWIVGDLLAEDQAYCWGVDRPVVSPFPSLLPWLARGISCYLVSALLYCSYLYISVYSRICAHRWCNIIVIFVTSGDCFPLICKGGKLTKKGWGAKLQVFLKRLQVDLLRDSGEVCR